MYCTVQVPGVWDICFTCASGCDISLCVYNIVPCRCVPITGCIVCWLLEFGVLGVQQHDYHVAMPADTERGVDVSTLCCFHQRTLTLGSHARRAVEIRDAYQSREQSAW